MGAIVIRTRFDEGTESAEVATSALVVVQNVPAAHAHTITSSHDRFRTTTFVLASLTLILSCSR
jgi:hypothetical protein